MFGIISEKIRSSCGAFSCAGAVFKEKIGRFFGRVVSWIKDLTQSPQARRAHGVARSSMTELAEAQPLIGINGKSFSDMSDQELYHYKSLCEAAVRRSFASGSFYREEEPNYGAIAGACQEEVKRRIIGS